jgi:hypothetical protein
MKAEQTELFDSPNRKPTRRRVHSVAEAADATRRGSWTCWKACEYCSKATHEQAHENPKFRIYRLCERPGRQIEELCFEKTRICDHAKMIETRWSPRPAPPPPPPRPMSPASGWDDY